jgi:hypothetical protein
MWASPLKQPKPEKAAKEPDQFKKLKPTIGRSTVRRLAEVKTVDRLGCEWADRWVDQLIRERCLPPQLLSDDFESMLGKYLEVKDAIAIAERFRAEYRAAFPLAGVEPAADTLSWLPDVLRSDPAVLSELPAGYLDG